MMIVPPGVVLYWQHSLLFIALSTNSTSSHPMVSQPFQDFASQHRILVEPSQFPVFQMGSNVVQRTMPYLAQRFASELMRVITYKTHVYAKCTSHNATRQT